MTKYIVAVLLFIFVLSGMTWYEGWEVSSVALTLLGLTGLCALIVLVYLVIARRGRPSTRKKHPENLKESPEPAKQAPASHVDHGTSHGSSGGHGDGGHGHGGGILTNIAVIAFVGLCGFGVYLFARELQSLPPKTMHPIQVQGAAGDSKPLDTNPAHYCKVRGPDAISYPAKPEEWTEVSVTPGGYEVCTDPGPASGLITFECKLTEDASWEQCGTEFLFYRFKSKMPVTVWQEAYHS